jgi:hypothetical protein
MGFTSLYELYSGGVSKQWNPHDLGDLRPDPVVCDSVLDFRKVNETTNAELTIYLKVWLEPLNSNVGKIKDGDGIEYDLIDWTPVYDFPGWCRKVVDRVSLAWDNKLTLILPKRYDGLDWTSPTGGVWQPRVRCRFVFLIGDPAYYHCRVKVVNPRYPKDSSTVFRVSSRLWTDETIAVLPQTTAALGAIDQIAAAHETGHLLGLPHIGKVTTVKACYSWTDQNANACYAAEDPNPSLANNIMGCGMDVSPFNAMPWKQEFCKHANQDDFFGLTPNDLTATADLTLGPMKR